MLDKEGLKDSIKKIISINYPNNIDEAVDAWTSAYNDYAMQAEDGTGDKPKNVNKSEFEAKIRTAFNYGNYLGSSSNFESAISAYWDSATFETNYFVPPLTGKSSSKIISKPLPNGQMFGVFSDISSNTTVNEKVQQIVDVIHEITTTGAGTMEFILPNGSLSPPVPFLIK